MNDRQLKIPDSPKKFTYINNRKCEYCSKPIEDQARINRKHCHPWKDEFGVQHSCKRLKHSVKHEREDEILLEHNSRAKNLNKMISKMLTDHGDQVTSEIIDAYGICLSESEHFEFDGHQFTSYFIDFTIYSNPNTHMHRIVVAKV
jgi:hypothetical protein